MPSIHPANDEPTPESRGGDRSAPAPAALGNGQLLRIAELGKNRIAKIARIDPKDCQESYLFRDDFFCGVKYSTGPFTAIWMVGESVIQFFRNEQAIGMIELGGSQTQVA